MATTQDPRSKVATTPDISEFKTTPQSFVTSEYSFLLQMVMELQKSTGQLTEAVNSLKLAIENQNSRYNRIEEKLSGVTHKIYAAGVVLAILLVVGGWFFNKAWDLMVKQLTSQTEISTPTQLPP